MKKLLWFGSAGVAVVVLFLGVEWLAWLAGRRWYYVEPDWRAEWECDHAGC